MVELLGTRLAGPLSRAGIEHPDQARVLTRSQVLALPGVGAVIADALEAAMAGVGLTLRPEAPKPQAVHDPRPRLAGIAWSEAWRQSRAQPYGWDHRRDRGLCGRLATVVRLDPADPAPAQRRLAAAAAVYIAAADGGRAFPEGPPDLGGFLVKINRWLQEADRQLEAAAARRAPQAEEGEDEAPPTSDCQATAEAQAALEAAHGAIADRIGLQNFEVWIRPRRAGRDPDGTLVLDWPNRYYRDWIAENYMPALIEVLGPVRLADVVRSTGPGGEAGG